MKDIRMLLAAEYEVARRRMQSILQQEEYKGSDTVIEAVKFIVAPPSDAARLLRFIFEVETALDATIVHQAGTWDTTTTISLRLRRAAPFIDVSDSLGKMTDVYCVSEIPEETVSLGKKTNPPTRSLKEVMVILKPGPVDNWKLVASGQVETKLTHAEMWQKTLKYHIQKAVGF